LSQSFGLSGAVPKGRAPKPKRFIAIAVSIVIFSPEHLVMHD
jgi:hypothetical protein